MNNYLTIDLICVSNGQHMTKREEAEEAIKKLNNYNFMGSQLTVQVCPALSSHPFLFDH